MKLTDYEIWEKFKKGDSAAFELMYRNEIDFLINYGLTIVKDEIAVNDALHDLFVNLWAQKEKLSSNDNIRRYLLVSLKRLLIKEQKFSVVELNEAMHSGLVQNIEQEKIHDELASQKTSQVNKAIQLLSKKQQEILHLKYYQGMDYEAIAQHMAINYQSCRNLASSAVNSLKTYLKNKNIFE